MFRQEYNIVEKGQCYIKDEPNDNVCFGYRYSYVPFKVVEKFKLGVKIKPKHWTSPNIFRYLTYKELRQDYHQIDCETLKDDIYLP
jgi:hypothetical protein